MINQGFGILPNTILFDKSLSDKEKLLFVMISSLCAEKGYCRANNNYFADKLGITKSRISNWITSLHKKGYISIEIKKSEGNKRFIAIAENSKTYCRKQHEGIAENSTHNNTNNNKINNITISPQKGEAGVKEEINQITGKTTYTDQEILKYRLLYIFIVVGYDKVEASKIGFDKFFLGMEERAIRYKILKQGKPDWEELLKAGKELKDRAITNKIKNHLSTFNTFLSRKSK